MRRSSKKATGGDAAKLNAAVQSLLTEIINECEPIVFNGDGYSEALAPGSRQARAAEPQDLGRRPAAARERRRSRSCSRSTTCSRERELESRLDIYLEQYCKTVYIEATCRRSRWPRR